VELLDQRAAADSPARSHAGQRREVIMLCGRLEHQMAIEHGRGAAAHHDAVAAEASRLEHRFGCSRPATAGPAAPSRTLRATTQWSYDL